MTSFDRYLAIDWSAASRPSRGTDSVWFAERRRTGSVDLYNPPTRREAELALLDRTRTAIERGERLVVGVDASLGYPRGTSRLIGRGGPPWRAMWDEIAALIIDDESNRNNRFDVAALINERIQQRIRAWPSVGGGPFWGAPDDRWRPHLLRTKPAVDHLPEFRATEQRFRLVRMYPKSVWQLLGAGSVGSQTLTLIPVLQRLSNECGPDMAVWPFTTGLAMPTDTPVVIAEVWPSQLSHGRSPDAWVKDARQVADVANALAEADRDGSLRSWFTPSVYGDDRDIAEREEGWIAGPAVV